VEGTREIPLTSEVAQLLASLARRNTPHHLACKVAGLDGLTLHGLSRSFKSLT
jgi:hypothetical protein